MKRMLQWIVAIVLIGSLTIQANPFKTFDWVEPTEYENNLPIPEEDVLNINILCSANAGGPYTIEFGVVDELAPPTVLDVGSLVQNTPGTYYCVATAASVLHGTTSVHSNEVNFTVFPTDLGLTPKAPVLSIG